MIVVFCDGEGIDVTAESDFLWGVGPDVHHEPSVGESLWVKPVATQGGLDKVGGSKFHVGELWVPVKVSSPLDHLVTVLFCPLRDMLCNRLRHDTSLPFPILHAIFHPNHSKKKGKL